MWITLHKHVRVIGLDNRKIINLLSNKMLFIGMITAAAVLLVGWFVFSAKNVTLIVDGKPLSIVVHSGTVEEVLDETGIKVGPEDEVRPSETSKVYDNSVIVVARKQKVEIYDGTEKRETFMTMRSVPEILSALGITLGKDDEVEANLNPKAGETPSIQITRRSVILIKETEEIAYSVKREPDDSLLPFENKIVRKGENGLLERTIRVVMENGKETERKVVASKTVKQPVTQLVKYSTGTLSRGGSTYRPVKELTMLATAYTHTGNRTATGTWPVYGTVAVDPRMIPLGTPLYIEGYGFAVAADTGGAIKGNRVDVFLESRKNALKWGKKAVKVQILRKIN
jgi:uncharacterized protein YabE (DUF348 family)